MEFHQFLPIFLQFYLKKAAGQTTWSARRYTSDYSASLSLRLVQHILSVLHLRDHVHCHHLVPLRQQRRDTQAHIACSSNCNLHLNPKFFTLSHQEYHLQHVADNAKDLSALYAYAPPVCKTTDTGVFLRHRCMLVAPS